MLDALISDPYDFHKCQFRNGCIDANQSLLSIKTNNALEVIEQHRFLDII